MMFVALTLYAMFSSKPGVEPVADVVGRTSELRIRSSGFLIPFWMSVVALTWILLSQIHLRDWITASGMSAPSR